MILTLHRRTARRLPWLHRQVQKLPVQYSRSCLTLHSSSWHKSFSSHAAAASVENGSRGQLLRLIEAYRRDGHLRASIDPLQFTLTPHLPQLEASSYGLDEDDATRHSIHDALTMPDGAREATVQQIVRHLNSCYCSSVGYQISHLDAQRRQWMSERIERQSSSDELSSAEKRNVFAQLLQSEVFDHFLHKKYPTFKRYGLEGAESLIALCETLFAVAATRYGVQQIVVGSAHRGRLNLLVAALNYPARALFYKINGNSLIPDSMQGHDDVPSHICTTTHKRVDPSVDSRTLTISLLPNPSHLEAVTPVAIGKTRAEQMRLDGKASASAVLCLQLHGDAAFAGQGVVSETLQMQNLPSYSVAGTFHVLVNNQLGFTAGVERARSGLYASDVCLQSTTCPVLHVNSDDPEAVVKAARLALEYRQTFESDVCLDLVAYRRRGHNEADEPTFTQPKMYARIRAMPSVVTTYGDSLRAQGILSDESRAKLSQRFHAHLEAELAASKSFYPSAEGYFRGEWSAMVQPAHCHDQPDTGVELETLQKVGLDSIKLPPSFQVHPRLQKLHIDSRRRALSAGRGIDWATAEALALGTLLLQGHSVRFSGQDVERGTFSHRHLVFHHQASALESEDQRRFTPFLEAAYKGKAEFVSSHLSEYAVMGFEFGFSWSSPSSLVIWEAQFGDFANTAAVIIDNFIASGEYKWLKQSGLVLALPHGMDGAGPEHSSSRIERYLQLSDDASNAAHTNAPAPVNILVAQPSTPAQYFHLLRRQQLRNYRKPLILIAPKVLIRLESAVSDLQDMAPGTTFAPVLDDTNLLKDENQDAANIKVNITTLLLCTGQIYYTLCEQRKILNRRDVAFLRLEELSPFPTQALLAITQTYTAATRIAWVQEEAKNAGCWTFVRDRIERTLRLSSHPLPVAQRLTYIGRPSLASAAVGNAKQHKQEAAALLRDAFAFAS